MLQLQARKWGLMPCRLSIKTCIFVLLGIFLGIRLIVSMVMAGWLDQDVKDKIMVVYAQPEIPFLQMKQGMFSDFLSVVGALIYAERNGAAAVSVFFETDIYVDWRLGPNYWEYYFQPLMVMNPEVEKPSVVHVNRLIARYGIFGSFTREVFGDVPAHLTFPMSQPVPIAELRRLVKKYIQVQPRLLEHVNQMHKAMIGDACMVGLHYRGTDKSFIWPYTTPSYEIMKHYVDHALTHHCAGQEKRLYVATDEQEMVTYMETAYPGIAVYQSNSPRLPRPAMDGSQMGTHKSSTFSAWQKGLTAVVDMLMLSRTVYLVKNRSSLSDVSLLFSDTLGDNFTFVLQEPDLILTKGL